MLTNLKNHLYPNSIAEVIELLKNPNSRLLAGATGLSLENHKVETLIDLQNVNLSYIKDEGEYFAIGSMTSAHDIYKYEKLPGSLKHSAYCVGDTPIMHAVTIGGNLAKLYNWVDLPPILWALDASIVIYNPIENIMSSDEFFKYAKEKNLSSRRELITEIRVPKSLTNTYSEYQVFMITENEKSQLALASYFEWNGREQLTKTRFVITGVSGSPSRINVIENILKDSFVKDINIPGLISKVLDNVKLISSYKTSIDYRKHILGVYIKRTINRLKMKMEESKE